MPVAGLMIAHQVAGKATRDAVFLGALPVARLPLMVMATALLVVAAVPVYSRLIERFGPRAVVAAGFAVSALVHVIEWRLGGGPWVAVAIYLHIAGLSILLLSGFWSVLSELFDPGSARRLYGRIAAAGTIGGILGGLAVGEIARVLREGDALLLLAGLHACAAAGVGVLGLSRRAPAAILTPAVRARLFDAAFLRTHPHVMTIGLLVLLGTAGAAIADYLLKLHAVERIGSPAGLLRFFAAFYLLVQVATFLMQFGVAPVVQRLGIGRAIAILPAGVGAMGTLGLLYASFPMFVAVRAVESILRGSFFRSAYELLFVPMAPAEKHRTKTFLDVTCDRLGDAVGAAVVQVLIFTGATYLTSQLLGVIVAMAVGSLWLAARLDAVYLGVVERRLAAHGGGAPVVVGSETGWTVVELTAADLRMALPAAGETGALSALAPAKPPDDPLLQHLADLRSGDRARVERALDRTTAPDATTIAQVIQLLAWDDVVARAGVVLERSAPAHVGQLTDALLDPATDFAIRRRVPRILGTRPDGRALEGLLRGLDDARFEVRYQCSRAIRRLLAVNPSLPIDSGRILAIVERELAVPAQIWHGHRLIDAVDRDDEASELAPLHEQRAVEHVFSLLSMVLPAEPLSVALSGIASPDASLRGVAIEYLESVLPPPIWARLWVLDVGATPSAGDAPGQSDSPPRATPR
jgi:ATP:ADP antiporter, AAA family